MLTVRYFAQQHGPTTTCAGSRTTSASQDHEAGVRAERGVEWGWRLAGRKVPCKGFKSDAAAAGGEAGICEQLPMGLLMVEKQNLRVPAHGFG